jgi:hypothetical protein
MEEQILCSKEQGAFACAAGKDRKEMFMKGSKQVEEHQVQCKAIWTKQIVSMLF